MSPTNDLFLFVLSNTQNTTETGVLGRPIDVRGTTPEPRFGHSMTVLNSNSGSKFLQDRETLAVVAGGTGTPDSEGSASVSASLSSVYILSRIFDRESKFSHFIWDCILDAQLLSPRTYHAIAMTSTQETTNMYVFGGVTDVCDPFDSFGSRNTNTWFEQPIFEKSTAAQTRSDSFAELPPLIGSSAATLALKSNYLVLHVGGAKAPNSHLDTDSYGPLNILTFCPDKERSANELIQAELCSVELDTGDAIDFASCVHNCLVALPNEEGSAITVGGGVPSFSFGQSYARSYLINVTQAKCDKTPPQPSQNHSETRQQSTSLSATLNDLPSKTINGVQVDVIYVAAHHAKTVKTELESLNFLDKRYKMIKVDNTKSSGVSLEAENCVGNLIAIPVTKQYSNRVVRTDSLSNPTSWMRPNNSFETLVVGRGTEVVPFSSSSMGKMKQSNGLR